MERLSNTMKLGAPWQPSWQMRYEEGALVLQIFHMHIKSQHLSFKGGWSFLRASLLSAPDLPWRSVQGQGQRWPPGRNRRVPGPGDRPATGRVGPLHPHRASEERPVSGTDRCTVLFTGVVWCSAGKVYNYCLALCVCVQEKRKQPGVPNGTACQVEEELHAEHHGPELQRTGRWGGVAPLWLFKSIVSNALFLAYHLSVKQFHLRNLD